ncbi:MAG TPA: HD domain-containing protein [Desulfomonilaceae bacterium]|nr:HD domain-containing protein [Desulfomonilaceae bacterium]
MYGDFEDIYRRAQPYLATRDNEIHTLIAYQFACELLLKEGGDKAVVLPAVILHDVGWKAVPEELHLKAFGPGSNDMEINRIHEVEGAKIARSILEQTHYDPALTEEIVEIILGHDSRKEALSLNDAIVKDADKLWRFSKEALQIDPERFGIDPAVHAEWLKHQIGKWFITETAAEMARLEQRRRAESFKAGAR